MKFEMQLWEINSRLYNDGIVRASIRKYVQDNKELTDEIKSKVAAEINKKATSDLSELANLYTTRSMLARFDIKLSERLENLFKPRFYVSTSKSIIKALINMHSFEIQLSPIG
ncbi:TPA: hypothetical protein JTN34_004580 [Escherichia coli]|nr:hypothetical protein [Escherichia coli]HAX6801434.1 hypothetical protein [Escherichia coli]